MAKNKGCVNKECVSFKKRTLFNNKNNFCPICGETLYYVCKKCHTQLEENTKLCLRHLEEREQNIESMKETGAKIAASAGVVAVGLKKYGKDIIDVAAKLINK